MDDAVADIDDVLPPPADRTVSINVSTAPETVCVQVLYPMRDRARVRPQLCGMGGRLTFLP
jgi:hypothetical protein